MAKAKTKKEEETVEVSEEAKEIKEEEKEVKKEYSVTDLPGVGPAVAAKLENAGYADLMSLAVLSPSQLSDISGVTEVVARKAILAARNILNLGFQDASQYLKKRAETIKITTGCSNIDNLIGGGVETRALTETYGAYGSGKTQLAHQLAVNVQLPLNKGGANAKAVYIDSEGTFRPERIKQMAEGAGIDPEVALKNIMIARAFNSDHQILLVEKVADLIKEGANIKLVIVDSLTSHFRAEFTGRGQLADRQQKLNKHMHNLAKLAEQFNLAVYITNQVMANPAMMFGDPTSPIGGHIVGHASTFRLYLRAGRKGSRVAKLIDSPNLPEGETVFFVTTHGLINEEEKPKDKEK